MKSQGRICMFTFDGRKAAALPRNALQGSMGSSVAIAVLVARLCDIFTA